MNRMMLKALASAAVLLAALAAPCPGAAAVQPKATGSLCRAPEAILFSCKVGTKVVSICGRQRGGAVYRFGRPGNVELEATNLHLAYDGWAGGGETQVYADTPTHRYIVYDRMVRTGFDDEGHNDSKMTSGLLVQSGGRTVASRECAQETRFDQRSTQRLVPEGKYVTH